MQFSKRPASATEISCAKEQQSCCLLHADWIHSLPSSNQRGVTVWLQMSFQNVTTDFRGKKIKNPALVIFFSLEMHAARNMYKFIFVWIVDEMTFTDRYFFLQGHQESLMTKSRRTRALLKKYTPVSLQMSWSPSPKDLAPIFERINISPNLPKLSRGGDMTKRTEKWWDHSTVQIWWESVVTRIFCHVFPRWLTFLTLCLRSLSLN